MKPSLRYHGCRITEIQWQGHTIVALENSRLRIAVVVTRGAEIQELRFKPLDLDVLWHTGHPLPPHHGYFPQTATGLETFFDHFVGGWQESFPMGNCFGSYRGAPLTLHGEVSLLPWDYDVIRDDAGAIEVEFRVACRRTPFELTRRMSLTADATSVRFDEQIINRGGSAMEYAWGHHPAFGAPFLTPGCKIDLPKGIYRSRDPENPLPNPRFATGQARSRPYLLGPNGQLIDLRKAPPERGGTMDNFLVELTGRGLAALRNPKLDIGVGFLWDSKIFPYLWAWEVSHGYPDYPLWGREYLLALEPFNCPIGGLVDFAGRGLLPKLKSNGRIETTFEVGFCTGRKSFAGRFI